MNDVDAVQFLQWALPKLELRWQGFRNVRGQVVRRLQRRRVELGLADLGAYRGYLEAHAEEWRRLDVMCRVTISRFARDRVIWAQLVGEILPRLAEEARAAGRASVRAWSAGCGAGEEPYSLAIAWRHAIAPGFPGLALDVLATDVHEGQLERAQAASYPPGTLRELPEAWRREAFERRDELEHVRAPFRVGVRFERRDLREPPPDATFDLILCRNSAFTYFEDALQRRVAMSLHSVMRPGAFLVIGIHEQFPEDMPGLAMRGRAIIEASP